MSFNSKLENCKVVASVFIAHSESYGFDDYGANLAKILQFWTLQQLVTWKLLAIRLPEHNIRFYFECRKQDFGGKPYITKT